MLKVAETRRKGKEERLSFSHSGIQDLNLDKRFDVSFHYSCAKLSELK
jgi:hypothetical protein